MSNNIQELLAQKAVATPEESRRIRRQLRSLGYKLSEKGRDPVMGEDNTTPNQTPVKRRTQPKIGAAAEIPIPPHQPEEEVLELSVTSENYQSISLEPQAVREVRKNLLALGLEELPPGKWDQPGYGIDLRKGITAKHAIEAWRTSPNTEEGLDQPQWFVITGSTNPVLVLGPVKKRDWFNH